MSNLEKPMSIINNLYEFEGGRSFDLKIGATSIGRSNGNDIRIKDLSVSRNHAKILREGENIFVVDLGSENGTWLYGHSVKSGEKSEIHEGDFFAFGNALVSVDRGHLLVHFEHHNAINLSHQKEENDYNLCDEIKTMGVKSIISVPLISKMGTVGVIYLHSVSSKHGFRSDNPFFVSPLSTPAALAIENALLHARSKQAENELRKARDKLELDVKNRTSELVIANDKLKELSFTDGLTGLYNYRYLMERLEAEYHRAKRYNHDLALIMIDIDHFKKMNDSFGHPCGDLIIKNIALLLKKNIRNTDLVARYGGDEMAIVLLETNKSMALEVSEKLRQKIEEHPVIYKNRTVKVTASIGVAAIPTDDVENWEGLVHAADKALYQAKNAGKNLVAGFTPVKDVCS